MTEKEFIAAIRIGTSCLTGIVGKREASGTFTVMAYETEDSAACIRRGCIRNVNDTAIRIKTIIQKLEGKMPGNRIGKVFVGLGGQSVRSREITVSRRLDTGSSVSDALMDELKNESKKDKPEGLDVLDVLDPACYLDGQLEANPVGTLCKKIDAKFQQAVSRHSFRNNVSEALKIAGLKDGLAGIIVSPLALADAVLSDDLKEMGCALIDFGAATTSVTVYKQGRLLGLSVVPLGGNLITKDLSKHFGITEADAEQNKRTQGKAVTDDGNAEIISVNTADKKDLRPIQLKEFYAVIAARQKEIIENVHARIKEFAGEKAATNLKNFLGAGVFITGNAAKLAEIDRAIADCMTIDVFSISSIRKGFDVKGQHPDMNPDYTSIGLLLHANNNYVNCAVAIPKPPELPKVNPQPVVPVTPPVTAVETKPEEDYVGVVEEETEKEPPKQPPKPDNRRNKNSLKEKLAKFAGNLFPDDE